ncbi:MAG: AbrB/MazE/SpoVT family DNA-binding domain-containing protein [Lysobacteraceae bacterium]
MRETLLVSTRGQITLPAGMRKQLGIVPDSAVIVEEHDDGLLLKPAAVLEIQTWSDAQIAAWDADDALSDAELEAILSRLRPG